MPVSIKQYIDSISCVLAPHFAPDQIYYGKAGAIRLAHEVGYGLASYSDKEINDIIPSLYSTLLVVHCFTRSGVPIDNKEFVKEIKLSIASCR